MLNPRSPRAAGRLAVAGVLALAGTLLAVRPAAAQVIVISPDRSVVTTGPQVAVPISNSFSVTPVVSADRRWVRIGGTFSFGFVNPLSISPDSGFIRPFTANDRARAANFYGIPGYNPNYIVIGPYQPWWR
jgi:hypothetical protein